MLEHNSGSDEAAEELVAKRRSFIGASAVLAATAGAAMLVPRKASAGDYLTNSG